MLAATLLGILLQAAPPAIPIAVVAHPEVPVDKLEVAEARSMFLKTTQHWPNGVRVRPVDVAGESPVRASFLKLVLAMSDEELQRHWVGLRYRDGTPPPPRLTGNDDVLRYVAAYPGALALVDARAIPAGARLKVLAIVREP